MKDKDRIELFDYINERLENGEKVKMKIEDDLREMSDGENHMVTILIIDDKYEFVDLPLEPFDGMELQKIKEEEE